MLLRERPEHQRDGAPVLQVRAAVVADDQDGALARRGQQLLQIVRRVNTVEHHEQSAALGAGAVLPRAPHDGG